MNRLLTTFEMEETLAFLDGTYYDDIPNAEWFYCDESDSFEQEGDCDD